MSGESAEYGVQAGNFSPVIYLGRLNKGRTQFLDKAEATDMVLAAVAHYEPVRCLWSRDGRREVSA